MLKILACLLLLVAACTWDEEDDDPCPASACGFFFQSSTTAVRTDRSTFPTAVGGTQDVELLRGRYPFGGPYETATTGDVVVVDHAGTSAVTLRAVAAGEGSLRILKPDGTPYGELPVTTATIAAINLVPLDLLHAMRDGESAVFAPDDHLYVGVELIGGGSERLVDTSMTIALAGGTQTAWDQIELPGATVGHHPLELVVGGQPRTLDLEVVDSADDVRRMDGPAELPVAVSTRVCFHAYNAGHPVIGTFGWHYSIDNGTALDPDFGVDCSWFVAATPGVAHITATFSGVTRVFELPVK